MDLREHIDDPEESLRAIVAGMLKGRWFASPARVTKDTDKGHTATVQPTIKREIVNTDGSYSYEDHPDHPDVPIHHMGGGGVSKTFPNKKDDTGTIFYAARNIDSWFQSDGTQQPMDDRMNGIGDGLFISGIRSIPRMLKQVAKDSAQTRSDDKKHVSDLHPVSGITHKSVDPSTAEASDAFDPFTQATKFFSHLVHPSNGIAGNATDSGTTHSHGVDHGNVWMKVLNGLHSVIAHPTNGASLIAKNGDHTVNAHPDNGVGIASTIAHTISAPNANLDEGGNLSVQGNSSAAGTVSGQSVSAGSGGLSFDNGSGSGSGGTMTSTGVGGDLSGTISAAQVRNIIHVVGADALLDCANDAAAATAGVLVGSLYRTASVLKVRVV